MGERGRGGGGDGGIGIGRCRDGETGRWVNVEMERWETGRWRDGRWGDGEIVRSVEMGNDDINISEIEFLIKIEKKGESPLYFTVRPIILRNRIKTVCL